MWEKFKTFYLEFRQIFILRWIRGFFLSIWFWIVGHPAELTYWFEGNEYIVAVRRFREIKPNHIMFKNMDTDKHVVVKSDVSIKYILREE
jgi:hypothetical protein